MKKIICIIFLSFFSTIFAQWQTDVRLTYDGAQSYMSGPHQKDIASSGNVLHVVWHDERTNWDIYYKRSSDAGATWGADTRLSNGPAESHSASVAVSVSTVIVVWNDNRDGHMELFFIRSTDGGLSWGVETRLTTNDGFSSCNVVAAISGSVVHAIWNDARDGNNEVYYKRSTDGGISWGTDTRLTNNASDLYEPSIAVSGLFIHTVWYDNRDGNWEIYYKRSTNGGANWGADTRLSSTPIVSELTHVAASGSIVHVAWQDDRHGNNKQIYYRRSTDGGTTWGSEVHLSDNAGYAAAPSITVSDLNVHITWQDNRNGNFEVYYKRSTDGGLNWGSDTRLTNASGNSLRTFSTITGTAVHVVWMDERNGNWEIFYKQDPTGNPPPPGPPPPPILVSPPNGSYNQPSTIRFIWKKSQTAFSYGIQIAFDSLFTNLVVSDTLSDSTIVVANLQTNKYYWWRVNAKNQYSIGNWSSVWKFGTFPVGVVQTGSDIPNKFELYNNYPNPFNPVSKIKFDIAKTGKVKLIIYDLLGREAATIVNEQLKPGTYEAEFNGSNYPSGIYFYTLTTETFTQTKKMVLIK